MKTEIYVTLQSETFKKEPKWNLADAWNRTNTAICDEINKWIPIFNEEWKDIDVSQEGETRDKYMNQYYRKCIELMKKHAKILGTDTSPTRKHKVWFETSNDGNCAIVTDLHGKIIQRCRIIIREA